MVKLGVEVLFESERKLIQGRRVGLVSNYTMTDSRLTPVIDLFLGDSDCRLVKLYGPEHGVRNSAKEGEHVAFAVDRHSGLPAYSLYGDAKKPTPAILSGIDVLVIDLQDIGCRYYTNMNTAALCLDACAQEGLPCVVLDRPNPIGASREGYAMRAEFASFVGMRGIPNRHGLTMGELARFHQSGMAAPVDLTVVPLKGWRRSMLFRETGLPFVSPSPNTSTPEMTLLYPGTCLFEGTNVSVGRGTARPFEMIGAPWIDGHALAGRFNALAAPGAAARPIYFSPHDSVYAGELCEGVQLHVTDARAIHALETGILLLQEVASLYPDDFRFLSAQSGARPFFDLLAGDDRLRAAIMDGAAPGYLADESEALSQFARQAGNAELYV
ncbi:MAG: exo-beta-N-acetylmuramidase NamZ family protein [Bacilli bacterium]